jgi:hypothetical protein
MSRSGEGLSFKGVLPPSQGTLILARVGGLNSRPPTGKGGFHAPPETGYYAFLWPMIEPFLLGSNPVSGNFEELAEEHSSPRSLDNRRERLKAKGRPGVVTRLDQLKHEGLRKFRYQGFLWTHFDLGPRAVRGRVNSWFLVHSSDLLRWAKKVSRANGRYNRDFWEVFVPKYNYEALGFDR